MSDGGSSRRHWADDPRRAAKSQPLWWSDFEMGHNPKNWFFIRRSVPSDWRSGPPKEKKIVLWQRGWVEVPLP